MVYPRILNIFSCAIQKDLIVSHPIYNSSQLVTQTVKNLPAMWKTQVQSLAWEDPLEKGTAIHSCLEFLPGEIHGQRSLMGYSP